MKHSKIYCNYGLKLILFVLLVALSVFLPSVHAQAMTKDEAIALQKKIPEWEKLGKSGDYDALRQLFSIHHTGIRYVGTTIFCRIYQNGPGDPCAEERVLQYGYPKMAQHITETMHSGRDIWGTYTLAKFYDSICWMEGNMLDSYVFGTTCLRDQVDLPKALALFEEINQRFAEKDINRREDLFADNTIVAKNLQDKYEFYEQAAVLAAQLRVARIYDAEKSWRSCDERYFPDSKDCKYLKMEKAFIDPERARAAYARFYRLAEDFFKAHDDPNHLKSALANEMKVVRKKLGK